MPRQSLSPVVFALLATLIFTPFPGKAARPRQQGYAYMVAGSRRAGEIMAFRVGPDGQIADRPFATTPLQNPGALYVDPTNKFLIAFSGDYPVTFRIARDGRLSAPCATYRASVFSRLIFSPRRPDILYSPYLGRMPYDLSTYRLRPDGRLVRCPWHFALKLRYGKSGFYDGVGDIVFARGGHFGYVQVLTGGAGASYTDMTAVRVAPNGALLLLRPSTDPPPPADPSSGGVSAPGKFYDFSEKGSSSIAISPDGHFLYRANTDVLEQFRVQPDHSLAFSRMIDIGIGLRDDTPGEAVTVSVSPSGRDVYTTSRVSAQAIHVPVGEDGTFGHPQLVSLHADGTLQVYPLRSGPQFPGVNYGSWEGLWHYAPHGHYVYLSLGKENFLYGVTPDGNWQFLRRVPMPVGGVVFADKT